MLGGVTGCCCLWSLLQSRSHPGRSVVEVRLLRCTDSCQITDWPSCSSKPAMRTKRTWRPDSPLVVVTALSFVQLHQKSLSKKLQDLSKRLKSMAVCNKTPSRSLMQRTGHSGQTFYLKRFRLFCGEKKGGLNRHDMVNLTTVPATACHSSEKAMAKLFPA